MVNIDGGREEDLEPGNGTRLGKIAQASQKHETYKSRNEKRDTCT